MASIIFLAPSSPNPPQSSMQSIPSFCRFLATSIASSIFDTPIICETPLCIEALSFLEEVPISSSQNIIIADRNYNIALVECNCDKKHIIKNDYVFTSNHFVSECMRVYQTALEDDVHSHERYNTLENAFKNYKYNLDFSKELLSGKYGFMCQYDKKDDIDTIWSSIYSIKDKKIYRAEGNPSRNSFKEDKRLKFSY